VLKNVIPGVTLNLAGADATKTVNLNITADTAQATTAIQAFVNSYNTAINAVNAQFVYNQSTNTGQPLEGDSSLALVQQQLYSSVGYTTAAGNNGINSLASLGITVNDNGTLSVDSGALSNALSSQSTDVRNFFQAATTGFAQSFNTTMQTMTDPTKGALLVELTGISTEKSSLAAQISDFESRMAARQQDLLNQYSQINVTLQQMPLLLAQINGQLAHF
jgi:flagellar hook-associated protein 2